MAITLPLPVRVAAGLLATGLERLRRLPQDLPALSVTVAGQAMRASMRVQQEIAELAGRGDELLAGVTAPPSERPEWARFDDEEPQDDVVTVDGSVAPDPGPKTAPTLGPDAGEAPRAGGPADADRPAPATTEPGADAHATNRQHPADPADPADMPDYDRLRLPQLRSRLRELDAGAVARLLEHETTGRARASYLTVLGNRLSTLRAEAGEDPHA